MIKKILITLAVVLVGLIAAPVVYVWQFDPDDYRVDLEQQLERATGYDVQIAGGLEMVKSPGLRLFARQVQFEHEGRPGLDLNNLELSVAWRPFFNRELQIQAVTLDDAVVRLWQDEEGKLLLPSPPSVAAPPDPPAAGAVVLPLRRAIIDTLSVENLQFTLQQIGETPQTILSLSDLKFELRNLLIAENRELLIDRWPDYLQRVALQSRFDVRQIRFGSHTFSAVQLEVSNQENVVDLDLAFNAYGGSFTNQTVVRWLADNLSLDSELSAETVRLSRLLQALEFKQKGEGLLTLNMNATTEFAPRAAAGWLPNLAGNAVLEGDGLVIDGLNVDRLVDGLLQSQQMTLEDVGGFALAGPLALLVTKGGDYTAALQGAMSGETRIPALRTELVIDQQRVHFEDVAFSTDNNRLAVSGHLNLADQTYGPLAVQVLSSEGCQLFQTSLKGPLRKPKIGTAELAAASVLNPLLSVAKKGAGLVSDCKPVYAGKVAHPQSASIRSTGAEQEN